MKDNSRRKWRMKNRPYEVGDFTRGKYIWQQWSDKNKPCWVTNRMAEELRGAGNNAMPGVRLEVK